MKCKKCGILHDRSFGSGIFCSRSCANSRTHSKETKDKISKSTKKFIENSGIKPPNNKGKLLFERETRYCPECATPFSCTLKSTKKYCSKVCADKNQGGYRSGSGYGKGGYYKGYWCDSSWELAYIIYNIDHHILFSRNTESFEYMFEGKSRNFIPDFIVNGVYIEIKGYKTKQWLEKLKQFKKPIEVLYEKDMKKYLKYVSEHYTSDIISLYDNYKPKYEYICNGCDITFKTDKKRQKKITFCSRKCAGKFGGKTKSEI